MRTSPLRAATLPVPDIPVVVAVNWLLAQNYADDYGYGEQAPIEGIRIAGNIDLTGGTGDAYWRRMVAFLKSKQIMPDRDCPIS